MQERIFKASRTVVKLYGLVFVLALIPLAMLGVTGTKNISVLLPFVVALLMCMLALLFSLLELAVGPAGIRQYPRFGIVEKMVSTSSFNIAYSQVKYIEVSKLGALNAKTLSITTTDYKKYTINSMLYGNFDQIIEALKQHVDFDAHEISLDIPAMEDIGQRVLHVFGLAIGLILLAIATRLLVFSDWHLSSENMFGWLRFSIPIGVLLAYAYIRKDKKKQALTAALLSGCLLGVGLNMCFVAANRLHTEHYAASQLYEFEFAEQKPRGQKWLPPAQLKTVDGFFYVNQVWTVGYVKNFKPGQRYQIAVKQGYLNDLAFAPDAFKNAREIDKPATQPLNAGSKNEAKE